LTPGSWLNNPDHISESLETVFWVKKLKFFDADPEWKKSRIRDPVLARSQDVLPTPKHRGFIIIVPAS
jgi:hypothetical protein